MVASIMVCMSARQLIPEHGAFARVARSLLEPLREIDTRPVKTAQRLTKIFFLDAARFFNGRHKQADKAIDSISGH